MSVITKTHIGAYGVIIKNKKIALIKKARGGYKGKLDLPGGGIEHTESPDETIKRELMEEIGCEVKNATLLDVAATNIKWEMKPDVWEDLHHIGILYNVDLENDELKKDADGLDSAGADWYDIKSLTKEQLSPFAYYIISKIRKDH